MTKESYMISHEKIIGSAIGDYVCIGLSEWAKKPLTKRNLRFLIEEHIKDEEFKKKAISYPEQYIKEILMSVGMKVKIDEIKKIGT
jgi:hypothetical protein